MKDLIQKVKIFYTQKVKRAGTYQRHGIKPAKDWVMILIAGSLIFITLIIFAAYFYIQIQGDKLFTSTDESVLRGVTINKGLLNKIVNGLGSREEQTNNLKNNGVKTADPSL